MSEGVAVVGGGFSGSALAIALLDRGARVTLLERTGVFGPGLAYGTQCDRHLLNVRSGRMSLRPTEPDHFTRWLETEGLGSDPEGFARRRDYGRYVAASLEAASVRAPGRLARVAQEAVALRAEPGGVVLRLDDGRELRAAHVVLATGNPPPSELPVSGLSDLQGAYVRDPWARGALEGWGPDDPVFLVGTGLTAIDVLLALDAQGWRGCATAVSRRGLLPRPHGPRSFDGSAAAVSEAPLSAKLHDFRRRARTADWTEVMDRMRPQHQPLWRAASLEERRRFLRRLRPWWDVHRHRTAPEIAGAVERWIGEGRLRVSAGRLQAVEPSAAGAVVVWTARGGEVERTPAARVVNCTGPEGDPSRAAQPLLGALMAGGLARPDPLGLGLDTDAQGRIIAADGSVQPRLSAVGPPTRGALWEIVAVPEIREQVQATADRLTSPEARPARGPLGAFVAHPREQGESYGQHLVVAFRFGAQLLGAGAAACVHGVAPFLFKKTASGMVTRLHGEMTAKRRCPPQARQSDP